MKSASFFGYKCPKCGSTVDISAVVGADELKCPACGAIMQPDPNGRPSATKAYCPNCKSYFGLINSDKCPICGRPFA